jgi:hypothetical protein
MAKTALQREIERLRRAERRFLRQQLDREPTKLDLFLEDKVPARLEATLDAAFTMASLVGLPARSGLKPFSFNLAKALLPQ